MKLAFVLGVNRSGTHLLLSLLTGHTRILVSGFEDNWISGLPNTLLEYERALSRNRPIHLYRLISYSTRYHALKFMSQLEGIGIPHGPRIEIPSFDFVQFDVDFIRRLSDPDDPRLLRVKTVYDVIAIYYQTLAEHMGKADCEFVVSKPANSAVTFLAVEQIFQTHPPHLLFLLRDPRAFVASRIRSEPRSLIEHHIEHWREHFEAVQDLQTRYPAHIVRYEDLCLDPEATLRSIAEFLNIEFEDVLLRPMLFGQDFSSNSSFDDVQNGISTAGVDRWRQALTSDQVRAVERRLGFEMAEIGYLPEQIRPNEYGRYHRKRQWRTSVHRLMPKLHRRAYVMVGVGAGVFLGVVLTLVAVWLLGVP
jgi:hypothetical protein